jgi:hypothetical protein
MDTWARHLPITSEMLLPLVYRAAAGCSDFSTAERVLYTACEFRSAMAAGALTEHLGAQVLHNLHYAGIAFSMIGARHVANTLNAAIWYLGDSPAPPRLRECLDWLERELARTPDPLDELIARHAQALKATRAQASAR